MKFIWVLSVSLAIIFLSCIVDAAATAVSWEKTFGEGSGYSVQETEDGGYIVAGDRVFKTDSYGIELWSLDLYGYSVQQTSDGGYIVLGRFTDVHLVKIDADGNFLWQKTFGGNLQDEGRSVQQTTDGGYIIAGYTESFGAGDYDINLIKTDTDGNELWSKTYGGSWYDSGYSVDRCSDGGYIIAGDTSPFLSETSAYLIKTDSEGVEIWSKQLVGSSESKDSGRSVQQTSDGGYIVTGYADFFLGSGCCPPDIYLIKLEADTEFGVGGNGGNSIGCFIATASYGFLGAQ